MATQTEELTRLNARLTTVRTKIDKQEAFREIEEGSSTSNFNTQFTGIDKLYQQEYDLLVRIRTLEAAQ